jgi:RNA-directed DNA polymerase
VTGISKARLEHEVTPLREPVMRARGLTLSPAKTVMTHSTDGFDFLGQQGRKYHGKLISKPARKNVSTCLQKVRTLSKATKHATAGDLIVQRNPLMRGWANDHQHVGSLVIFARVGHAIFQALWQGAKRRHPNTSNQGMKERSFQASNGQNWVCYGVIVTKEGVVEKYLLHPAHIPSKRQVKRKGEANPSDPAWEESFEKRLGVKMVHHLKGNRQRIALWKEQQGRCPICQQQITTLTGWHTHHLVWRVNGGKETADNRVLLHPTGHRQVHSQRLAVVKPRPARGERKA